jgi:hypothetical protein
MLEVLALLVSLAQPLMHPPQLVLPKLPRLVRDAAFQPAERAVTNWRRQAGLDLALPTETALRWIAGSSPANLPRCIRLNNYWCIKKAGWTGEIAADPEGHVAFASAQEGAVVAVLLLRRYYLDYGRKSARAIVSHWAPAQCGLIAARTPAPRRAAVARVPTQRAMPALTGLAKFGIGSTLRARWLAARGRGGVVVARRGSSRVAMRRLRPSVIPDGLALPEAPLRLEPPLRGEPLGIASASLPVFSGYSAAATAAAPAASCSGDAARIANYAARTAEGIVGSPDEDLKLFDKAGNPQPALSRLLANMAGVEIGPYRVDEKLIESALETVRSGSRAIGDRAAE